MPLHIAPLSRRRFLAGSLAAGGSLLWLPSAWSAETSGDTDRWALLSDTHIAADPAKVQRGVNMADNLHRVADQLQALSPRPAGVLISGDCALNSGLAGDYATLSGLLEPLWKADLPIHLTLGNHDDRPVFRSALAERLTDGRPLESRQATVIESPRANWFVLDSLEAVNHTPGRLGAEQLAWLGRALDQRRDKPALVVAHHNPIFGQPARNMGLQDTNELFEVLVPRKHVKAYIFGHTHHWDLRQHEGIHLVNLPPVAYLFKAGDPNGWVEARLADGSVQLELHALDAKHPANGQKLNLAWRAG
ncbi:MAG TPA: metallophosphoesterase [Pirellulales bacterium]